MNILLIFLVSWPNRNFNDNELILIDSFKDMNLWNEKRNNYNEYIIEIKIKKGKNVDNYILKMGLSAKELRLNNYKFKLNNYWLI